ncbi:hypothetical protein KDE12_05775 [Campylobacter sp. faydin G-105]|uniref:hypothetical protein n=1 Tax=Campylobacter anatolicus TaxID=2829105 RepID=UPI001B9FD67A|nr:hypothetical protein [Campylobacter anatolicus]MBR8462362.1 hypothetical protein [Campylobacter anatolicus]
MRFLKNLFITLIVAFVFLGCAAKTQHKKEYEITWTAFVDNDGIKREVGFIERLNLIDNKNMASNGVALVREIGAFANTKLGDMYNIAKNRANIIINLDTNVSVNPNSKADVAALKTTKAIKFYEFGGGIVESVLYSSDSSVCAELLSGKFINSLSITNYYKRNDGYFTNLIQTKMSKKGAKITKFELSYDMRDSDMLQKVKEFAKSKRAKMLFDNDIKKQGRLLAVLCSL